MTFPMDQEDGPKMTAIEIGLITALAAVVGLTALTDKPEPKPVCPSGSAFVPSLSVCLIGASSPTYTPVIRSHRKE